MFDAGLKPERFTGWSAGQKPAATPAARNLRVERRDADRGPACPAALQHLDRVNELLAETGVDPSTLGEHQITELALVTANGGILAQIKIERWCGRGVS